MFKGRFKIWALRVLTITYGDLTRQNWVQSEHLRFKVMFFLHVITAVSSREFLTMKVLHWLSRTGPYADRENLNICGPERTWTSTKFHGGPTEIIESFEVGESLSRVVSRWEFLIGNNCLLKVFMLHKSLFNLNEGQVALFKGTQLKIFSFSNSFWT